MMSNPLLQAQSICVLSFWGRSSFLHWEPFCHGKQLIEGVTVMWLCQEMGRVGGKGRDGSVFRMLLVVMPI